MPYQDARAAAEIVRILDLLANNGYPTARFDVEHSAKYKSSATKNFVPVFVFIVGKQFRFGDISIHVDPPREDITDNLSLRQLDFQPGEIYSLEKKISSERNLNRVGLFESARIDHPTFADTSAMPSVPIDIFVRPRARNELSPERS